MGAITQRRQLVERVERMAREAPREYRMRLALLALLGFGVLLLSIALSIGLSVGAIAWVWVSHKEFLAGAIKLLWIPLVISYLMLSALWVRFDMPEGLHLRADEAPMLQAEIERLRAATNAPRLDAILIDEDLNAAAAVVPRMLGLLGTRRYLVLGLPLMQRLSPEEFTAVLAHEFGHFGGQHGRFAGWIYYLRTSWVQLLDGMAANGSYAARPFLWFFEWYAPYFDAYSFVLRRQQEYEADATAARWVDGHALGRALMRLETGNHWITQHFWPELDRTTQPHPPKALLADIRHFLRSPPADESELLARLLAHKGDDDDSHPRLSDRLAALGVTPELPPVSRSAAEFFLGDLEQAAESTLNARWHDAVEALWHERHAKHVQDAARTRDLADPAQGDDRRLGEQMLARDDAEGVALLRRAMAADPDQRLHLLAVIDAFYARTGTDLALRDGVAEEIRHARHALERVAADASRLTRHDRFVPHGLDAATLDRISALIAKGGYVKRAWLVRKDLGDATRRSHHVLVVSWRFLSLVSSEKEIQRIADGLALDGSWFVCEQSHVGTMARRKIQRVEGAAVYHRR